ncbi:MAG TPA: hypothetical protein VH396_00465 [Chitinophagaceae bacterium]|jgi:hypothetical protein
MKKLLFILIISIIYSACTNRTAGLHEIGKTDPVSLPYIPDYSSKFSIANDSNSLAVLNNYKAWETGDMDAFRNTLGDSISFYFSNGEKFRGTRDSVMYYASKFRDSLSKVEIKMDAWIPLHTEDKNQDWVSVWYTEIDTYKNGKVDSAYYQDDNMLDKNRRIVYTDSHKRVLK